MDAKCRSILFAVIFLSAHLLSMFLSRSYADTEFIDQNKVRLEQEAFEECIDVLAICSTRSEGGTDKCIVTVLTEGGEKNLILDGLSWRCEISPNGRLLAVVANGLHIVDLRTYEVKKLDLPRRYSHECQVWSSDSSKIYLVMRPSGRNGALYSYDLETKELIQLTTPSRHTRKAFPSKSNKDYVIITGEKTEGDKQKPCLHLVVPAERQTTPIGPTENFYWDKVCCSSDDVVIYYYADYHERSGKKMINMISVFRYYDIDKENGGYLGGGVLSKYPLFELTVSSRGDIAYSNGEGVHLLRKPYKNKTTIIKEGSKFSDGKEIEPRAFKWAKNGRHLFFSSNQSLFVIDVETEQIRRLFAIGLNWDYDIYPK